MKPPFWEVTVSRQSSPTQPPVIESVNCFTDLREAEDYRKRTEHQESSLQVTIRLVTQPVMKVMNTVGARRAAVSS